MSFEKFGFISIVLHILIYHLSDYISYSHFPFFFMDILEKSINDLSFFFFGLKTSNKKGIKIKDEDKNYQTLLKALKNGINPRRIQSFTIILDRFFFSIFFMILLCLNFEVMTS